MENINNNLKILLDELVKKYEIPDFINDDPIKFPHMFQDQENQEVAGLISSSIAYGKVVLSTVPS